MNVLTEQRLANRLLLKSWHRVLIVAFINITIVILCTTKCVPMAENNDDFIVHTVLGGAFGQPSEYISIVNVLLAKAIVMLQNAFPLYNWFAILLYAFLCASFISVASVLWLVRPSAVGGAISVAFSSLISVPMYLSLQYTKYAIFIAAAGILCVLYGTRKKPRPAAIAVGALLCVFSAMVRLQSIVAGAAVMALPVLFVMLENSVNEQLARWIELNFKIIASFSVLLVAIFCLQLAHNLVYKANPQAEQYSNYLSAQQKVTDYDLAEYNDRYEQYDKFGITENDLEMIRSWSNADSEKFSGETLVQIAKVGKPESNDIFTKFMQGIKLFTITKSSAWFFATIWVLCLTLCDNKTKIKSTLIFASYFVLLFALSVSGRVTRWVCMGILAAECVAIAWCFLSGRIRAKKGIAFISSLALAGLCVWFTVRIFPETTIKPDPTTIVSVYEDIALDGDNLYIADMSSMPSLFERISIFKSAPKGLYNNVYMLGGWETETPAKNSVLERYNVDGSPYKALVMRDDVLLIDNLNFDSKAKFIRENYSKTACWSLYNYISGLAVYAFCENIYYTKTDEIEIVEYSQAVNEYNESYRNYNFIVSSTLEAKYCFVEFDAVGNRMTYRAYPLKTEGDKIYMSFGVYALDLPDISGKPMRAIIKTSDGKAYASKIDFEQD